MPFKSPQQETWMWVNKPEMAKKWFKEHGHAPGYKSFVSKKKRKSRRKKRSGLIQRLKRQVEG